MRKLIYSGLFLAIVGIGVVGCKKEQLNRDASGSNKVSNDLILKSVGSEIPMISNPRDVSDYFKNENDADDTEMSRKLHEIAVIARPLFINGTFNQYIIDNAKLRDNSCVDLNVFTNSASLRSQANDQAVFDALKQKVNSTNLTHRPINTETNGELETYLPAIFVANIERADPTKKPIFSAGTYVNNELSGVESYQDYIVAWFSNDNGGFTEILINEETAMSTTHPIFIVDNAEASITQRAKSTVKYKVPVEAKNMETAWYSTHEFKINHRYDNTLKSEFCITGAHITNTGEAWLICKKSNGTFDTWKKIKEIHKNSIGQMQYQWEQFCNNDVTPFASNYVFWNTYERDWAKSEKDLGSATKNGITIYLTGRRQYTSEWYAYDPGQVNNNRADLSHIYWNWAKWHDNSKGQFRIWRIQP